MKIDVCKEKKNAHAYSYPTVKRSKSTYISTRDFNP